MTGTVDVTLEVPHPIFYGVPRTTEGQGRSGHSELTASAFLQWDLIRLERVTMAIAAGPTFHRLSQELVTEVSYLEAYPYDAIEFEGLQVAPETVNAVGGIVQVSADTESALSAGSVWTVGRREGRLRRPGRTGAVGNRARRHRASRSVLAGAARTSPRRGHARRTNDQQRPDKAQRTLPAHCAVRHGDMPFHPLSAAVAQSFD